MTTRARVARGNDGLWVTPQIRGNALKLLEEIRDGGVPARRRNGMLEVPRAAAPALLRLGLQGVTWSSEAELYAENVEWSARAQQALADVLRALDQGGVDTARERLRDVDVLPGLDDHQLVNVAAMAAPDICGLCLFDEQGAGKTVSLIAAFDVVVQRDEADLLLIFSPKSMIGEWVKDFHRFTSGLYRVRAVTGGAAQRRAALADPAEVVVTNYETASGSSAELLSLLATHGRRTVIAVDESYHVKNSDALRSRAIFDLRQRAGRTFVLCGTPAPNTAHDLVAQVSLVDFGATFGEVALPQDATAAKPIVRASLDASPVYLRHLKAHVLPDLPGRRYHQLPVPMAPVQRQLYEAARDGLVHDLRNVTDAEFQNRRVAFAARRMTLMRLCSNPAGVVDDYTETPGKLAALDRLLAGLIEGGEKVVLWSFFKTSIVALADRYADYGVVRYDGSVTDANARSAMVRDFQEDETTKLFIGNPAAAGAGLTLHRAHTAVYESMSNQPAHYLQSLDRIHRRGQAAEVDYYFLLSEDSVEEVEYDRLLTKQLSARELLLDDDQAPVTRQTMLADILGRS